jgi:hypothetical protein
MAEKNREVEPAAKSSQEATVSESEVSLDSVMGSVVSELGLNGAVEQPEQPDEPKSPEEPEEPEQPESPESPEEPEAAEEPEKPDEPEFTPEMQAAFDKRVGKEVRRRKELEEKLSDRDAKIADLELKLESKPAAVPANVHPLEMAESMDEFDKYEAKLDQQIETLEEYAEDGYEPEDGEGQSYSAAEIHKRMRQLERERSRVLPKIRKKVEENLSARAAAAEAYPDLKQADSELSRSLRNLTNAHPALKSIPNWPLRLADMLQGEKERTQGKKQRKPAAPAPKIPTGATPKRPSMGATPPKEGNDEKDLINEVAAHIPM